MANNKIQIKRSVSNATVTGLSNGELAFTQAGNVFFIGAPDGTSGSIRIGGLMVPGTLTANQALVANSTSGIDKIIVANAAVSQLNANGSTGTAGHILLSGGAGANSYWAPTSSIVAGAAGTDTQIQFNDGGSTFGATAGFTFTKTTNTVAVSNTITTVNMFGTTVNATTVNATSHTSGGSYGSATPAAVVNTTYFAISSSTTANSELNATNLKISNSTTNSIVDAATLTIQNSTFLSSLTRNELKIANAYGSAANAAVVNSTTIGISSNSTVNASFVPSTLTIANSTGSAILNTIGLNVGGTYGTATAAARLTTTGIGISSSTTANAEITASLIKVANSTSNSALDADKIVISNSSVGSTLARDSLAVGNTFGSASAAGLVNTTTIGISSSATVNNVITVNDITIANGTATGALSRVQMRVGGSFGSATAAAVVNTTTIGISSSATVNAVLTPTLLDIDNGTSNSQLTVDTLIIANGTVGSTLGRNSLAVGNTFGSASAAGLVNTTTIGISSSATVNNVITVNDITIANGTATGALSRVQMRVGDTFGSANPAAVVNTTNIAISTNAISNAILSSTSFVLKPNSTSHTEANTTKFYTTSNVQITAANIDATSAFLKVQNIEVSGNLTVLGDVVSVNVATLSVEDSLIELARNGADSGSFTDLLDVGFFGKYGSTANAFHTGLFRDQSDSGIYKLYFANTTQGSTDSTVNTSPSGASVYRIAQLEAFIKTQGATDTGGLLTNATNIYVVANSTVQVNVVANTLSLSVALPTTSGGTGTGTYTSGDILVGNTGNALTKLSLGTSGKVLQSTGTALVYDDLDGGTF